VVSWRQFYVLIFHERKKNGNERMKKQFEHERDDKGKKVIFFSRKSIGSRVGSSNFIG